MMGSPSQPSPDRRPLWGLAAALVGVLAMAQGLSASRIFYFRDLSFHYWPAHLWQRRALMSGELPLWDAYVAFGQPAIADPVRQLLFLPALPLRLLPEAVGFNLLVLLPIPVAAVGFFVFLRKRFDGSSAAVGAATFAVGGPLLSTASSLNWSWTAALVPWVLWTTTALSRTGSRRWFVAAAATIALQALAGEPLTLATGAALALAWCTLGQAQPGGAVQWLRRGLRVGLAMLGGLVLAAAQLLPLAEAALRSRRAFGQLPELLALHPMSLLECLARPLFHDPLASWTQPDLWAAALNDGHTPMLFSNYAGVGVLSLAALALAYRAQARWCVFWSIVVIVAVVLALGRHFPGGELMREWLPVLRAFRYPAKHFVLASLALGALAAAGFEALRWQASAPAVRRALQAVAVLNLLVALAVGALLARQAPRAPLESLARSVGCADPALAASQLAHAVSTAAPKLALLAGATAGLLLLAAARRRETRLAAPALLVLTLADLVAEGLPINGTFPAAALAEPSWAPVTRGDPNDRMYVGGRVSWFTGSRDLDDVPRSAALGPPEMSRMAATALYQSTFASFPAAWRLREGISVDMTELFPREFGLVMERFARAGPEERRRFLVRTGTRYLLVPRPPRAPARRVLALDRFPPIALYELPEALPRASIVPAAVREDGIEAQLELLFSEGFDPTRQVVLQGPVPEPAGTPGAPREAAVTIEAARASRLQLRAHVPESGGYLVLLDSAAPGWTVEVDEAKAPLLRANALFRAVRLSPGEHLLVFRYRPRSLLAGTALSLLALITLAWWVRVGAAAEGGKATCAVPPEVALATDEQPQAAPAARRRFRHWSWVAAVVLVLAGLLALVGPHRPPRQAIVVLVDTLRWDALGCYASPERPTPQIDALAAQGVRFEQAISSSGWTLPAVASMLTGAWPTVHGAIGRISALTPIRPELATAAEVFRRGGFNTLAFTNAAFLSPFLGLDRGFDVFDHRHAYNREIRRADETIDAALVAIGARRRRPNFVLIHLFDPHLDYDPPAEFRYRYTRGRSDPPAPLDFQRCMYWRNGGQPPSPPRLLPPPSPEDAAYVRQVYLGEVAFLDRQIGRLLEALREWQLYDEATIVVTADHGEEFWEHGGFEHGHSLYDELVRVPLVLKLPSREKLALKVVPTQVRVLDVMPTLFELAGLASPESFVGSSLLPLLRGSAAVEQPALSESILYGPERVALRLGGYKYIMDTDPASVRPPELYDLERDPGERSDLAQAQPEIASKLGARLRELHAQAAAQASSMSAMQPQDMSPQHIERLKSLGYIR